MMKRYIYNGKSFDTEVEVRQAIWESEHKIFGKQFTEDIGVKVEEYEVEVPESVKVAMADEVRFKRDHLLRRSDFYMLPDYPSDEAGLIKVRAYRQALRDITKQAGFPSSVVFPEKPKVLS